MLYVIASSNNTANSLIFFASSSLLDDSDATDSAEGVTVSELAAALETVTHDVDGGTHLVTGATTNAEDDFNATNSTTIATTNAAIALEAIAAR